MGIFKDVTLTWQGEEYTVPSNKVMQLIAKIEDCVTLQELSKEGGARLSRISQAYMVALNHAGCKVEQDEVYASMFGETGADSISAAVTGLLMMMLPPGDYQPDMGKTKATATKKRKKKA